MNEVKLRIQSDLEKRKMIKSMSGMGYNLQSMSLSERDESIDSVGRS